MQYKVNDKGICIPPYISTNWQNVISLHLDNNSDNIKELVVTLSNHSTIKIPGLDENTIEKIFQTHSNHFDDGDTSITTTLKAENNPLLKNLFGSENIVSLGLPMRFGGNLEGIGSVMQHNPSQANAPDLPLEILEKVAGIAKAIGGTSLGAMPKPEPHCNCMHCQIARAIHNQDEVEALLEENQIEEEVTDEDLRFREWDITQTGTKLYTVANPLDSKEQFSVYLGEPIGCTCGSKNCEHIRAVLSS